MLYSEGCSEPRLDARCQRLEITDALYFVIGKLHVEVIFQTREQFQCLQAVDTKLLVEIVARLKVGTRNFEMSGGEIQDFVGRLLDRFHDSEYFTGSPNPLAIALKRGDVKLPV